jgi:ribosome-associated translation inhibitor RaiA
MDTPFVPTITFRGLDHSPALETEIRKRVAKLTTFSRSIVSCRVLVEFAERRREAGNRYHVRVEVAVPGDDIVITHEANLVSAIRSNGGQRLKKADEPGPERRHALVAVREAFEAAKRRLQDRERQRRKKTQAARRSGRSLVRAREDRG